MKVRERLGCLNVPEGKRERERDIFRTEEIEVLLLGCAAWR